MQEQKYTATAQNPKALKDSGALELNMGLLGDESVKREPMAQEIEDAKTAAKACKKATRKIPALLSKLVVLKVQYGTRGRTDCADKEDSAATAQELCKINAGMEEFMEQAAALCVKAEGLDKQFTENAEEAVASAVTVAEAFNKLSKLAEEHAECASKKLKLLQATLNQLCLKDDAPAGEQQIKQEDA